MSEPQSPSAVAIAAQRRARRSQPRLAAGLLGLALLVGLGCLVMVYLRLRSSTPSSAHPARASAESATASIASSR